MARTLDKPDPAPKLHVPAPAQADAPPKRGKKPPEGKYFSLYLPIEWKERFKACKMRTKRPYVAEVMIALEKHFGDMGIM